METQDTELPVQLLLSRFNYHLQMMEHFEIDSKRCEHHSEMVTVYGRAIDILKSEEKIKKMVDLTDKEKQEFSKLLDEIDQKIKETRPKCTDNLQIEILDDIKKILNSKNKK